MVHPQVKKTYKDTEFLPDDIGAIYWHDQYLNRTKLSFGRIIRGKKYTVVVKQLTVGMDKGHFEALPVPNELIMKIVKLGRAEEWR